MGDNCKHVATGALLRFRDQAFAGRECEYRWDVRDWAEVEALASRLEALEVGG